MDSLTLPFDAPTASPIPVDMITMIEALIAQCGYETVLMVVQRLAPVGPVPSAPARWTDPDTSHAAAKREHDVGRFGTKSRQAKLLALFESRELTDQEATIRIVGAHASPSAFDGCRRRCSDLRAVNYLIDTGKRRKNPGSDDLSIVWRITFAGRAAIKSLEDTGWSR